MATKVLQEFIFKTDYENTILLQSDYLVYGIIIAYIIFVKFLGPSLMKKRKALDLYYFVILFNVMLVVWNAYLCISISAFVRKYWHTRCYVKYNPELKKVLKIFGYIAWQGFLVKLVELIDTVIFILRKKLNQASFFHIFHHSIVVLVYWMGLRRTQIAFYGVLFGSMNTGVHVLTYLYYGLSAIGPSVKKHLWWKKYLTMVQLLQFFVILTYFSYNILTGCEEFDVFEKLAFSVLTVICGLLLNFYFKTYSQSKIHLERRHQINGVDKTTLS